MSWVNVGEVVYVLRRSHGEESALATLRDLRGVVEMRLPTEAHILRAAQIKASHPMAYADAFAASLAVLEDAELWTGDPELLLEGSAWRWRDLRRS